MKYKHIVVSYWSPGSKLENVMGIKHVQSFQYSRDVVETICAKALDNNYQVMLRSQNKYTLSIIIDNKNFRVR